jgi:hypothetical protein
VRIYFGTVFSDGRAAVFKSNFEIPDDDHIGQKK